MELFQVVIFTIWQFHEITSREYAEGAIFESQGYD